MHEIQKNSASVSSFRIYSQKKPPSENEDNENTTVLYHIQFCDPFRTANSSWPELSFPYCAKAGLPADRSSGLTPSRFPSGFCLPSRITVTSSYRIHTCFPFHRINRNLLSSDTLRFSMWSIFGNFYRYLFNRMSISFCVHTVNHYSVIVGKTHEKIHRMLCCLLSHRFSKYDFKYTPCSQKIRWTPADFPLFSFFICQTFLLLPSYP